MLRWIIETSLKFRHLLVFLAVILLVSGTSQITKMPIDVFPEFSPPLVEVQTEAQGLSTEEVEGLITVPIENALAGMQHLDVLRSKSVPGLSSVVMIFKRGTDIMEARQLVGERLAASQGILPNVSRPPVMIQPLSATSRVMKIGLSSKSLSLVEMSETYRWKIRPWLMKVQGVANVAVWGQRKRQLQVQVDPERLAANGLSLNEVMEATSDALDVGLLAYREGARTGTGGFIENETSRMKIRHVLPVVNPEGLSQVSFRSKDGRTFLLGDVTRIVEGHPPMIGDGIINDGPGLLLIVEKFPWANTFEVTHNVERALEELKPAIAGIAVDPTIFRPATFIETAIDNLKSALLIGVILVIGVLFLFLYEWRVALISMVAIPLSLLTATLVLAAMGATINTMVLAGLVIAIGAVVDDAIIDVENIVRRLRESEGDATRSIGRVIVEASLEVRSSIVYATLIIVLAIVPVFFLEGLSGAFFQPLATSYSLALLASMLVALTLTPALCYLLLSARPVSSKEPPFVSLLKRGYSAVLTPIVKAPAAAVVVTLVLSVAGFGLLPFLGQALLPSFKERDFLMHWVTKPGTSHDEMNRITIAASNELRAVPGVQNFGAHVGRAVAADEVVGINFTENWISVHPDADYDATLAKIQEVVDGYPGLYRDVMTYLKERIREVLTGSSEAIVIRVYGPELAELRKTIVNIKTALADVKGMKELHGELIEEIPHIAVKVDLDKAQSYGLKPGDVRRAASAIIGGIELSDIYMSSQLYDVLLIGSPHLRQNLTTVQNLMIDTPNGGQVKLVDVASVAMQPTPNVVKRERASRRMDIAANLSGERDLGSVVRDVEARLKTVDFPTQYHAELIGEHTERKAAEQRIFIFSLAALVGIFVLLQASFGSWRLATVAFLTLPSALVGGIIAAWVSGGIISLGSLVGFITVLGIAGRNAILLINHYQHLEQHEGMVFGRELALRGAMERLSPILMTALTTGLGIVPLVVAGNLPGHEIEHPMAVVILGGLVSSCLLNLFILPTIYLWLSKTDPFRIPQIAPVLRGNPAI